MKAARNIVLLLAAVLFLLALGAHVTSFLNPTSFLSREQIAFLTSGWTALVAVAVPIAGVIIASDMLDVEADSDWGRVVGGLILFVQLFIRMPLWMRLIPVAFFGYLIVAPTLSQPASSPAAIALRTLGAMISALNLLAIFFLGATMGKERR